jgi:YggT family protein
MGDDYLTRPLVFLIQIVFQIYLLAVLLRFILQLIKADFYNPLSQFIVRVTSPPLRPLRRLIPGYGGLDWASLVLAWLLKTLEIALILLVTNGITGLPGTLAWALPELVAMTINIYLFAILVQVIMSWINPGAYNPALSLLERMTAPLLRPSRNLLPPMGGIDLSPMLTMIGLVLLEMLLLPPLRMIAGSPL